MTAKQQHRAETPMLAPHDAPDHRDRQSPTRGWYRKGERSSYHGRSHCRAPKFYGEACHRWGKANLQYPPRSPRRWIGNQEGHALTSSDAALAAAWWWMREHLWSAAACSPSTKTWLTAQSDAESTTEADRDALVGMRTVHDDDVRLAADRKPADIVTARESARRRSSPRDICVTPKRYAELIRNNASDVEAKPHFIEHLSGSTSVPIPMFDAERGTGRSR